MNKKNIHWREIGQTKNFFLELPGNLLYFILLYTES